VVAISLATSLIFASMPSRGQSKAVLEITQASWGYAGERKNVKEDVAKICDGKPSCKFTVANETFTTAEPKDPSPGNAKGLLLRWKCGESEGRDQIPHDKTAELKCP
jgi:hypothetical protein